jgi:hypothetical protein
MALHSALRILSRCAGVRVTYKKVFGLDDWIYWHLIDTTRNYRQYSAIAHLHNLQSTVAHALGLSVVTSRILATDLKQSHWHFKLHMKSSFRSLISFLPLFFNYQFRRLDSIQFLCTQVHIPEGCRLETRLSSILDYYHTTLWCRTLLSNHCARTTQNTQPLLLRRRVYWSVT